MIDVAWLLDDPAYSKEYAGERHRSTIQSLGDAAGEVSTVVAPLTLTASITPLKNPNELQLLPEGLRSSKCIKIFTQMPIYAEDGDGISSSQVQGEAVFDMIVYDGGRYKVYLVRPWLDHGFYEAIAVNSDRVKP